MVPEERGGAALLAPAISAFGETPGSDVEREPSGQLAKGAAGLDVEKRRRTLEMFASSPVQGKT